MKFENRVVRNQYVELYEQLKPRGPHANDFELATSFANCTDGNDDCFSAADMKTLNESVWATQAYVDRLYYNAENERESTAEFYASLKNFVAAALEPAQKLYELQHAELCDSK
ncbi:MAG: hypothetical protein R3C68_14720 [Myxococcota bacterium]